MIKRFSTKTQKARRIEQQLRAIEVEGKKRKITKKEIKRLVERGNQWKKRKEKKIYDKKIQMEKKEKEQCTFRPEINEISKVLFQKSNGRLCTDLQSPRSNYLDLMRVHSPRGHSERRKDQRDLSDETNINLMLKFSQHLTNINNHSKIHQEIEKNLSNSQASSILNVNLQSSIQPEPYPSIPVDDLINAKLEAPVPKCQFILKSK